MFEITIDEKDIVQIVKGARAPLTQLFEHELLSEDEPEKQDLPTRFPPLPRDVVEHALQLLWADQLRRRLPGIAFKTMCTTARTLADAHAACVGVPVTLHASKSARGVAKIVFLAKVLRFMIGLHDEMTESFEYAFTDEDQTALGAQNTTHMLGALHCVASSPLAIHPWEYEEHLFCEQVTRLVHRFSASCSAYHCSDNVVWYDPKDGDKIPVLVGRVGHEAHEEKRMIDQVLLIKPQQLEFYVDGTRRFKVQDIRFPVVIITLGDRNSGLWDVGNWMIHQPTVRAAWKRWARLISWCTEDCDVYIATRTNKDAPIVLHALKIS